MDEVVAPLSPSAAGTALAEEMRGETGVMETILRETVESAEEGTLRESGRTTCGGDRIRAPGARFPKSVQLRGCPVESTGTWHTHVTQSELRHPEHSLPDWANVIFHGIDASMVVGTQSLEQVVAASDRAAMADAFQSALGVQVRSSDAVVSEIQRGNIPDPPAARERVRQQLSGLVERHPTDFEELDAKITAPTIPAYHPGFDAMLAVESSTFDGPDTGGLRRSARNGMDVFRRIEARLDLKDEALSNATGIVVGSLVSRVLGLS